MKRYLGLVVGSVGILLVVTLAARWSERAADALYQSEPPGGELRIHPEMARLRLVLGRRVPDAAQDWSGSVTVSSGELVRIRPVSANVKLDGNAWTGRATVRKKKGRRQTRPVVLELLIDRPAAARVRVRTAQGDFEFAPSDVGRVGAERQFLAGSALVRRLPLYAWVADQSDEEDYPSAAVGQDGTVWVCYVAYQHGNPIDFDAVRRGQFESLVTRGNGDQIRLAFYRDDLWREVPPVTKGGLDVWKPQVAVDGQGRVWVVWSENVDGNWDIYARAYDPSTGRWGARKRISSNPGSDINVAVATRGTDGSVWAAWQGFVNGQFDVFLASVSDPKGGNVYVVSDSPANDWYPDLAAAPDGKLWIAWDSYAAGNYDVFVRALAGSKLGEIVPVAASARYEARPSVAVDRQGRVWVAFEDSDPNWAKDYGDRWPGTKGVPFYWTRNILVRCVVDGKVYQTAEDVRSEPVFTFFDDPRIKPRLDHRISIPELHVDAGGRLWLFYRRHPLRSGSREVWFSYVSIYGGDRWSEERTVPASANTLDRRPAVAPVADRMLLVYASDHRGPAPGTADNDLAISFLDVPELPAAGGLRAVDPHAGPAVEPVHPNEAADVARMRQYRVRVGGKEYRLLRGEFHRHTELSAHRDWDGPFEELWRYAYDAAAMDWIGPGDHDYPYAMQREYNWWFTQKQIDMYHNPPSFVPMFTYERSVVYPSGHRNVMFAERGIRTLPRLLGRANLFGTPETGSPDVQNLYRYLKHFGGICAVHTSATNMGTDWRDNDPEVEPVVEIFQGHRQNYEEPNAPMAPRGPDDAIQGYHPDGFVWNALAKGYRLGFQSSSDHVSTHISYAVVLAEERSRQGVLDAFRRRHCYAAQDNIVLDVRCGNAIMGDVTQVRGKPELRIIAHGTCPIVRIDIVRRVDDGQPHYAYSFEPDQPTVDLRWRDTDAKAGRHYMYYVRIQQANRALAWSSPIWVSCK